MAGDLMPNAVPIERRRAAYVQSLQSALEKSQARVQVKWRLRSGEHASGETLEPARAHVVDGEIGRYSQRCEVPRRHRVTGLELEVQVV